MRAFLILCLPLAACADPATTDADLAAMDPDVIAATVDATWEIAPTLHEGTHLVDHAAANARRVHSLWVSGSNMNHVPLDVEARAQGGNDVRIAVLGPLVDGTRQVLAADGYAARKRAASVTLDIHQPGEHLVVVGSYDLATETTYDLSAVCPGLDGCGVSRYDVLATPKDGALVGDDQRAVDMLLGDVMVGHEYDVDVELWASPPMQSGNAVKVATATASGTQVHSIVPASVRDGDDLKLVVRQAGGGRILDTGITTRFVTAAVPLASTGPVRSATATARSMRASAPTSQSRRTTERFSRSASRAATAITGGSVASSTATICPGSRAARAVRAAARSATLPS